jgi:hypothetical protein
VTWLDRLFGTDRPADRAEIGTRVIPDGPPAALSGTGVAQLRSAQAAIRALARRPPVSAAIPARVEQRIAILPTGGGQPRPRQVPALIASPAQLRVPDEMAPLLEPIARTATEASRRRRELEPLLGRLIAGTASTGDRVRLRHLATQAVADLAFAEPSVAPASRLDSPDATRRSVARARGDTEASDDGEASEEAEEEGSGDTPVLPEPLPDGALGAVVELVDQMLGSATVPGAALHLSSFRVPETAVHDFTQYQFLRDPNLLGVGAHGSSAGADLDLFIQSAWDVIVEVVETEADAVTGLEYAFINLVPYFPQFEATIFQLFLRYAASPIYEAARRVQPGYPGSSGSTREDMLVAFDAWLTDLVRSAQYDPNNLAASFDYPGQWVNSASQIQDRFFDLFPSARLTTSVDRLDDNYTFTPFPIGIVNFGLRLVYRQEWRPLGTQPGEIVRTIPLGPKQTEKVSTRVVINQRESRTAETFVSTETTTEASSVTRESSDVVEEASKSLKWHVDVEASASYGFGSGSVKSGVAGETASSSKDTKSRLNEAMEKTSSRMRRDMKVVVSTERSVTEEITQASEITNPNDEVAVTYVYSKLQRQYEIQTKLAEVQSVVFIPERIPAWNEIDEGWVRRHDWILNKVLLDSSFEEDLAEIAREPEDVAFTDTDDVIAGAAKNARDAISEYKTYTGGTLPDLFSSVQSGYERSMERTRGVELNRRRRSQRSERFLRHVRENILHYMRAIWSAEDADQRLRRYSRMLVGTRWTFSPTSPPDPTNPELEVAGEFLPDLSPSSLRPLTDVINPAGPVGYAGNYAVYYLKSDPTLLDLNQALTLVRSHYVRFDVTVSDQQGNPVAVRQAAAVSPRYRDTTYELKRTAGGWTATEGRSGLPVDALDLDGGTGASFDGLTVRFDATPGNGTTFQVRLLATGLLEDPELRLLRLLQPLPKGADAATFFSPELLADMATYVPELAVQLPADLSGGWGSTSTEARETARRSYHMYLLLKEHTRRFLLETNNLLVDLEVGQTPGLELFKRLHRVVDVLKEVEEASRRSLENARRRGRLEDQDYADPDIEQVTVIGGADELRAIVGPVVGTPGGAQPGGGGGGP